MSDFKPFSTAVYERFIELSKHELFVTVPGQELWDAYLAAYPEGSNPIYKTRTEHDCSCCKQFVRNIGNVVAIINGKLQSIWKVNGLSSHYQEVADKLDKLVTEHAITALFRPSEPSYGAFNTKQLLENGQIQNWNHFHGIINAKHKVRAPSTPDKARGDYQTSVHVFKRGLEELKPGAVTQVLELINDKAIYRGAEHLGAVQAFKQAQAQYLALPTESERNLFVWANANENASRFRNTVIGTLVQDISDEVDVEHAVRGFESKVAPTNYKRPTALVTPSMVKAATATIADLGLEPALARRFATITDITINNVLWADSHTQQHMKGGLEGMLMNALPATAKKKGPTEDITMDEFMTKVLPTVRGMALQVQGLHLPNLVSLTAPVHVDAPKLFTWDNAFAWSYSGNLADSIKDKVKAAGGNVTNAKLRVSLAWTNYDDLDIHVCEPNGNHIYFGNKCGRLDVDMNAGSGRSRTPVENVSWTSVADGDYKVKVNQYCQRESDDVGCVIEVESMGKLSQFAYSAPVKGMTEICTLTVYSGMIVKITTSAGVVGGGISQDCWGITTEKFVPVQTLMYSPNYWDGQQAGNKHWFFMLEGCKNPDPARGIYNEFLSNKLTSHRKVFELLGNLTKCPQTDNQLSGLGFSSTRNDTVTVEVTTATASKLYSITF